MNPEIVTKLNQFVAHREDWKNLDYVIIKQNKHIYDENNHVFKLLSNSLARVSTPLDRKSSRCVAVNMSIEPQNNERFLLNFRNF
jgi:thymidylate synthase